MLRWLNGEERFAGDQRIATCYSGHQFGVWAGQLGDGRALSLGELVSEAGERREVQVKGLGRTPYSRMGDGRAVIRSSVREFLCAEFLHALRIPTTRSLALVVSDTPVQRERAERAAIVARVFPTQVRFGHFEHLYHSGQHPELKLLIDYVRRYFMPEAETEIGWFRDVVTRTAHTIAAWQAYGFCHGVMNTDNMSILGLTLDYGPFAFLAEYDPNYICNHSDHEGRYSFGNQPKVALWNLHCLASCLLPFIPEERLREALSIFERALTQRYSDLMAQRLGVRASAESLRLTALMLEALENDRIDYNFFLYALSQFDGEVSSLGAVWSEYPEATHLREWLGSYRAALELDSQQGEIAEARVRQMNGMNPAVLLRSHVLQRIIEDVERDDFSSVNGSLEAVQSPFEPDDGDRVTTASPLSDSIKPYRGDEVVLSCSS
jgi:uncharacterized protein YdiU (UPF0061 family)